MRVMKLPKGYRLKDGRLEKVFVPRDASHAIRARKSKRQRVVRPTKGSRNGV